VLKNIAICEKNEKFISIIQKNDHISILTFFEKINDSYICEMKLKHNEIFKAQQIVNVVPHLCDYEIKHTHVLFRLNIPDEFFENYNKGYLNINVYQYKEDNQEYVDIDPVSIIEYENETQSISLLNEFWGG
jgi:hypothetical protein